MVFGGGLADERDLVGAAHVLLGEVARRWPAARSGCRVIGAHAQDLGVEVLVAGGDLRGGAHFRADAGDAADFAPDGIVVFLRSSVPALPKPMLKPPRLTLPDRTRITFWPKAGDLGLDLGLGAVADADHGDDRADADDDAEHGQQRAQEVPAQRAQGDLGGWREVSWHELDGLLFLVELAQGFAPAMSRCWHRLVVDDAAVAHDDVALGVAGDVQLVGDHDDGDALARSASGTRP